MTLNKLHVTPQEAALKALMSQTVFSASFLRLFCVCGSESTLPVTSHPTGSVHQDKYVFAAGSHRYPAISL